MLGLLVLVRKLDHGQPRKPVTGDGYVGRSAAVHAATAPGDRRHRPPAPPPGGGHRSEPGARRRRPLPPCGPLAPRRAGESEARPEPAWCARHPDPARETGSARTGAGSGRLRSARHTRGRGPPGAVAAETSRPTPPTGLTRWTSVFRKRRMGRRVPPGQAHLGDHVVQRHRRSELLGAGDVASHRPLEEHRRATLGGGLRPTYGLSTSTSTTACSMHAYPQPRETRLNLQTLTTSVH